MIQRFTIWTLRKRPPPPAFRWQAPAAGPFPGTVRPRFHRSWSNPAVYGERLLRFYAKFDPRGPVAQRLEQQTHNLLVVGSSPTGPTKILCGFNQFRRRWIGLVVIFSFQLRGSCVLLRSCFAVQPIYPVDTCSRHEVSMGVDRDLNRAVAHLVSHAGEGDSVLGQ